MYGDEVIRAKIKLCEVNELMLGLGLVESIG